MRKVQTFERIVLALKQYWQKKGCLLFESYNSEVGAGTFNPATFIRVLDERPWNVCYIEVSKRPRDGRYGENPDRVEQHRQMQIIMKPAPKDIQKYYLQSLESLGLKLTEHEVRFVEGDWEAPTLGAWGLGWEVWLDGSEITQFTYFQQVGGVDLKITPVEITYGLERIATIIQEVPSIYDIKWNKDITWGDILRKREIQFSAYNFEIADPKFLKSVFVLYEEEAQRALDKGSVLPGYDYCVKCSNIFNILEARGTISISERAKMIGRVRALANQAARLYIEQNQPAQELQ
jgi:glycyl-tRNA synthetase alpha chain